MAQYFCGFEIIFTQPAWIDHAEEINHTTNTSTTQSLTLNYFPTNFLGWVCQKVRYTAFAYTWFLPFVFIHSTAQQLGCHKLRALSTSLSICIYGFNIACMHAVKLNPRKPFERSFCKRFIPSKGLYPRNMPAYTIICSDTFRKIFSVPYYLK